MCWIHSLAHAIFYILYVISHWIIMHFVLSVKSSLKTIISMNKRSRRRKGMHLTSWAVYPRNFLVFLRWNSFYKHHCRTFIRFCAGFVGFLFSVFHGNLTTAKQRKPRLFNWHKFIVFIYTAERQWYGTAQKWNNVICASVWVFCLFMCVSLQLRKEFDEKI